MNCALCHGGFNRQPASLATALYPRAPNLISDPPEDPEWHIFYAIRTGIRYTGMPAWEKTLSQQDIWKVTALLSHLNKLPPAVQEYWKTSFGVAPPSGDEKKEGEGMKHDKD
jgi:mono/diheme cytochrome c family protein